MSVGLFIQLYLVKQQLNSFSAGLRDSIEKNMICYDMLYTVHMCIILSYSMYLSTWVMQLYILCA